MNAIIFETADLTAPGRARIGGRRLTQLREVIKATPGKICRAGLRNGLLGRATVLNISATEAEFEVVFDTPPPPPSPVTLIAALPRPQTFTKLLHAATELGVKSIYFIHSFKVEKSYWSSPRLGEEYLRSELTLALEQSCDTTAPVINFRQRFKPFAEDELPQLAAGALALLGDPAATAPVPTDVTGKTLLALGPEGGFTDYENAAFTAAGFRPVTLGPRVLRTEVAAAALLGRLQPPLRR